MPSAWGNSWGDSWGNSWGDTGTVPTSPQRYPDRLIALGFQGTINDMEYAYLKSLGYTSGDKQDAKKQHLENLGYSGSLNDMLKQKADAESAESISRMMREQGIIPV